MTSRLERNRPGGTKTNSRIVPKAQAIAVVLAALLTCFSTRAHAVQELELFGSVHTDSVRAEAAFALRDADQSLSVDPRNLRKGQEHHAPWWREPDAALLLERSMGDAWVAAFERDRGHPPIALPLAVSAVAVVVNTRNPVVDRGLRVVDLRRIVSAAAETEPEVSFWGQLGLEGEWKMRPVSVLFSHDAQAMELFRDYAMDDAATDWNVGEVPGGAGALIEAVERDQNALGITVLETAMRTVGVVPISDGGNDSPVAPTEENIRAGRYPLAGCVHLYLDRAPGEPLGDAEAALAEFLLSDEGQRLFAQHGYVPLDEASTKRARSWLSANGEGSSENQLTPQCQVQGRDKAG